MLQPVEQEQPREVRTTYTQAECLAYLEMLQPYIKTTPLLEYDFPSLGFTIWGKYDYLQETGASSERGTARQLLASSDVQEPQPSDEQLAIEGQSTVVTEMLLQNDALTRIFVSDDDKRLIAGSAIAAKAFNDQAGSNQVRITPVQIEGNSVHMDEVSQRILVAHQDILDEPIIVTLAELGEQYERDLYTANREETATGEAAYEFMTETSGLVAATAAWRTARDVLTRHEAGRLTDWAVILSGARYDQELIERASEAYRKERILRPFGRAATSVWSGRSAGI